jgi:hypothetical protein
MIFYMIRQNPLVICGLFLIGLSGLMLTRIQLRMLKAGCKFPYAKYLTKGNWEVPRDYLTEHDRQGWSPWIAYLIGPVAMMGVICLVLGLFRMH